MKFHVSIFVTLITMSAASVASYNPYSFSFYFQQKPCVPFSIYYLYSSKYTYGNEKTVFYGTDLDYAMEMWSWYPPLYVQHAHNNKRNYVDSVHVELYKQKNEEAYHLSCSISAGFFSNYGSHDTLLSKDVVEKIFNDTRFPVKQFPVKQFPENIEEYHSYSLGTSSLKELSEGEISHAFQGFIAFVNVGLQNESIKVKLDPNDLGATMNFRKKWLSLATWTRWLD